MEKQNEAPKLTLIGETDETILGIMGSGLTDWGLERPTSNSKRTNPHPRIGGKGLKQSDGIEKESLESFQCNESRRHNQSR